jgi:hypothetical protein
MATSSEQITDLIHGYTDLKQYFEGARARIKHEIETMYDTQSIYVDSNTGDDANEGSSAAPLRTFGMALTRVRDGGKTVIQLREGLVYGTSGGNTAVTFNAKTTIEIRKWDNQYSDPVTHPILHLENTIENGQNSSATTIFANNSFKLDIRGVKVVCDVPSDETIGWVGFKRKFVRAGHSRSGVTLDIRVNQSIFTVPPNAVQFAGPQYFETIILGVDRIEISGDGALVTDVNRGVIVASVGTVVASNTTKLLDGGTLGENVLTNSPTVTL